MGELEIDAPSQRLYSLCLGLNVALRCLGVDADNGVAIVQAGGRLACARWMIRSVVTDWREGGL